MVLASATLATALAVFPLSQVQPGQKGVCLTEWTGGEKIQVPVEIVGLLQADRPAGRAVLVKLLDPRFHDTGVVAGMSGSPVYVDGQLLGAVAFGWNFAREALAGVTPFEDMQAIPVPGTGEARGQPTTLAQLFQALAGQLPLSSLLPALGKPSALVPLLLPLGSGAASWPPGLWQELGLLPVPGAAGQVPPGLPEPGDMVAALLVWGDAVIAAGGTLTARQGQSFYAFGHPLVAAGPVRMPAARARVLAVQSSFALPFKIFAVGEPFGTFLADQTAGLVAVAGPSPAGLPVSVHVQSPEARKDFSFYLAEVPLLQPLLVAFLTASSLSFAQGANSDLTVGLALQATFADGSSLRLRQEVAAADAVARVATFAGALVSLLTTTPFPAPALSRLDLQLSRRPHQSGQLLEALVPQRKLPAGQSFPLRVRLQPRQGPEQTHQLTLTLPPGLVPGRADLLVADAATYADYALRSENATAQSFPQLLELLRRLEPSSTLVVALETREAGLSWGAGAVPALPLSLAFAWQQALTPALAQRLTVNLIPLARLAYPWPVAGALRLPLEITAPEAP